MSFCEKCRSLRGIAKGEVNLKHQSKVIDVLDKIFNKIATKEDITEQDLAKIKSTDVINDDRYELMKEKDKKKFNSAIKAIDKNFFVEDEEKNDGSSNYSNSSAAYFVCKFCNYSTKMQPGTVIYSKKYGSNANNTIEDYRYVIHDNSLARTRTYICKNEKCKSHSDISIREAVLTNNASEQLVYVCTVCNTSWINSL